MQHGYTPDRSLSRQVISAWLPAGMLRSFSFSIALGYTMSESITRYKKPMQAAKVEEQYHWPDAGR